MVVKVDRWGPIVSAPHSGYRRLTDLQIICDTHQCAAEQVGALGVSPLESLLSHVEWKYI